MLILSLGHPQLHGVVPDCLDHPCEPVLASLLLPLSKLGGLKSARFHPPVGEALAVQLVPSDPILAVVEVKNDTWGPWIHLGWCDVEILAVESLPWKLAQGFWGQVLSATGI
jgi:hypothetical protein